MTTPKFCLTDGLFSIGEVGIDTNTLRSTLMNALRGRRRSPSWDLVIHITQLPTNQDIDDMLSQVIDDDLDLVGGKSDDGDLCVLERNRNTLVDTRPADISST